MKTKYLFFLLTFFIFGCDAVKQVEKSADKTQKVVDHYLITHPFTNDTSYHFTPGDTTVQVIDNVDTVISIGDPSDTTFYMGGNLQNYVIDTGGVTFHLNGTQLVRGLYMDTVPCKTKTILKTQTIIKTVHDTLTQKIVDKSFSDELQRQNNVKAQTISDLTAQLRTETAAHRKWVIFFWLLIAVIVGWLTKGIWAPGISKILTLFK